MIISYEDFQRKLNSRIKLGPDFHYGVLISMAKNPKRYTGLFRLSNAKTKLIQNATQSREIKFGDFMEDIVTDYISELGYANKNKSIGSDEQGNTLSADQVFTDNKGTMYLIEQKIRDDHDSTKKRGQYQNFKKKYDLLAREYPEEKIIAGMWFIDSGLIKNRNYYVQQSEEDVSLVEKHVLYGDQFFKNILNRADAWDEIVSYLERNKLERSTDILTIPDLDTSDEMFVALLRLKNEEKNLYRKLLSSDPNYEILREELFPTGFNLRRVGLA